MHPSPSRQRSSGRHVWPWHGASTARLGLRVLEPNDIHHLADLYDGLSPRSRFLRFMSPIQRLSDSVLEQLASIDHDRHEAIGAFDCSDLIASAHWFRSQHHPYRADLAIEVTDQYQRQGIGSGLLRLLGHLAGLQGIVELGATILTENTGAISLLRATGWPLTAMSYGAELTVAMAIDTKA